MREKSKSFCEFHEDATDRGWSLIDEKSENTYGYGIYEIHTVWKSTYANGERRLLVTHNPDGIATIVDMATGESIPQADHNRSPINEEWLDVLTVD